MTADLQVLEADPFGPEAQVLITRLSEELGRLYGDDGTGLFAPGDAEVFVLARLQGRPVGCGALCRRGADVAEVKRMYVDPAARGRGVGRGLLAYLESAAQERGFARLILETGTRQVEALNMYEGAGYARIPAYGPYVGSPLSVCFEKRL